MSDPRFPTAQGVPNRSLWTVLSELGDEQRWQALVYHLVIEAFPEDALAPAHRRSTRRGVLSTGAGADDRLEYRH